MVDGYYSCVIDGATRATAKAVTLPELGKHPDLL